MSIELKINGVDRTDYIDKPSFQYKNVANDEVDTLDLTLKVNQSNLSTVKPVYGQTVLLSNGGTLLFGGKVVYVREIEVGFNVYHLECTVKDFSFEFTKERVADAFKDVTDLFIVNNIVNDYVNLDKKIIDGMESGWSGGVVDTTHYVQGTQSIKISGTTITKAITLDLTEFSNGKASDDNDFIDFWYYVDDDTSLTSIQIKLGDAPLTNTRDYTVSSGFSTGWNYFHIVKSDFTETGTMAWSDIVECSLTATGAANVSFDDIRLISADGVDKENVALDQIYDVAYLSFNYLPAFQSMQDLCNLVGKYWYIDENNSLHYFTAGFEGAPFGITDTNGKMIQRSLVVEIDGTPLKNVVYVRGGQFLANTRYEPIEVGDGEKRSFQLDYKGQDLKVYIDRGSGFVEETVGLDNIDDDDGTYSWFWNNTEKFVKQASAGTTLTNTDKIKTSMYPYLPVIIEVPDDDSISKYGRNTMLILDKNIKSKEGARERGLAELAAYKEELVDATFETYVDGLKAGQEINVLSTKRDINRNFIIWSVSAKMHTKDTFRYNIELISKKKLTLANTLIQLLLEKTKNIEVDSNETLDKYKPHREEIIFQEVHNMSRHVANTCKWGPHADQGTYTTYYLYS